MQSTTPAARGQASFLAAARARPAAGRAVTPSVRPGWLGSSRLGRIDAAGPPAATLAPVAGADLTARRRTALSPPMIPFQAVLDEHGPALYRHLVGVLGPHDGADCFQETVLAALRAWPPPHDGNLRAWLFAVAHNKVVDHARAGSRRAVPVAEVPEPAGTRAGAGAAVAVDTEGDARRARIEGDGDDLWDAIRLLPHKQRVAVALRHAEDWSYADIAVVLGCSEAAARQSVKAGLDRLREVLS